MLNRCLDGFHSPSSVHRFRCLGIEKEDEKGCHPQTPTAVMCAVWKSMDPNNVQFNVFPHLHSYSLPSINRGNMLGCTYTYWTYCLLITLSHGFSNIPINTRVIKWVKHQHLDGWQYAIVCQYADQAHST